jgi:hypothetical protein
VIFSLSAWLVTTGLIGYAAVFAIWPGPVRWMSAEGLLRSSLAVGLGFGISACALFLAMLVLGPSRPAAVGMDLALLTLLAWAARRRAVGHGESVLPPHPSPARLDRAVGLSALALLAVALVVTLALALQKPQGDWDAWGIYNLTARFMYRGGASWQRAFSTGLGIHPDYPLLLPASSVRGWLYVGRDAVIVPEIMGVLLAYAVAGLLVSAVWVLRGRRHGALAAVALFGTPFFLTTSASQYADLPLTFYFLASIVLFAVAERAAGDGRWLLMASGLCAGLAAWTKNEGLLYALLLSAGIVAAHRGWLRGRSDRRAILAFIAGLLPMLAMIAYFKLALAPANDLVSGQGSGTLPRLLDGSRYWLIVRSAFRVAPRFPIIPAAIFVAIVGVDRDAPDRRAGGLALFLVVALAAGYAAVYVTSPNDLAVQIHRSLDRLIMQLWPLVLFVVFMAARIPEQAVAQLPSSGGS